MSVQDDENQTVKFFDSNGAVLKADPTDDKKKKKVTVLVGTPDVTNTITAVTGDGEEEKEVGKLNVVTYKEEVKELILISVNGAGDNLSPAEVQEELNRIYAPAAVVWTVKSEKLTCEVPEEFDASPADFKGYSSDMNQLISDFKNQIGKTRKAAHIFLLEKSKKSGQKGIMPLSKDFGFIFTEHCGSDDVIIHTIAHELGHGVFSLWHPFDEYKIPLGTTDNLMDYGNENGTNLFKYQWDLIKDPIYVFGGGTADEASWLRPKRVEELIETCNTYLENVIRGAYIDKTCIYKTPGGKLIKIGGMHRPIFMEDHFMPIVYCSYPGNTTPNYEKSYGAPVGFIKDKTLYLPLIVQEEESQSGFIGYFKYDPSIIKLLYLYRHYGFEELFKKLLKDGYKNVTDRFEQIVEIKSNKIQYYCGNELKPNPNENGEYKEVITSLTTKIEDRKKITIKDSDINKVDKDMNPYFGYGRIMGIIPKQEGKIDLPKRNGDFTLSSLAIAWVSDPHLVLGIPLAQVITAWDPSLTIAFGKTVSWSPIFKGRGLGGGFLVNNGNIGVFGQSEDIIRSNISVDVGYDVTVFWKPIINFVGDAYSISVSIQIGVIDVEGAAIIIEDKGELFWAGLTVGISYGKKLFNWPVTVSGKKSFTSILYGDEIIREVNEKAKDLNNEIINTDINHKKPKKIEKYYMIQISANNLPADENELKKKFPAEDILKQEIGGMFKYYISTPFETEKEAEEFRLKLLEVKVFDNEKDIPFVQEFNSNN
ncbi:MAG: hypothetical protein GY756_27785 [bacterium]|nr:hypothetical protein [bacterium]